MNNSILYFNLPDPAAEKKSRFMKAQMRVGVMLFISFGITVGCGLLLSAAYSLYPEMSKNELGDMIVQMMMYLSYMAIPVFTFGLLSGKKVRSYFTLGRGGGNKVAVFFAALGFVYFAQLVAAVLSDFLTFSGFGSSQSSADSPSADAAIIIMRFITIAVLPAIFEELMMRGILLGELLPYGKGFAIVISGVLFGLMHMNVVQLPFACIAGVAMAFAAVYTGSLRVAMLIHFTNNLISVVLTELPAFIDEEWAFLIEAALSAFIFLAGIAAVVYLIVNKNKKSDVERKALCVKTDEADKVDLRQFSLKDVSPVLYAYIAVASVMAILNLLVTLL